MAYQQITVSEFSTMLQEGDVTVIDIRDEIAFGQGHIENALNVNPQNIESFIREADMEKPLVVCCYHGNSSQGAADFFNQRGFSQTFSLIGGFAAYQDEHGI